MKILIISNGIIENDSRLVQYTKLSDVVVCADGGVKHLKRVDLVPDVVIGDMDSIGDDAKLYIDNYVTQNRTVVIRYPAKKDASDTELAVLWAIKHGATEITLTGVTGTRMDHTLSNILMLHTIAQNGVACKIVDDHNEIYMLSHDIPATVASATEIEAPHMNGISTISVQGTPGSLLSIIPVTNEVTGITISGFEYPLNNATMKLGSSHGVSNVFTSPVGRISLTHGTVLVIKSSD